MIYSWWRLESCSFWLFSHFSVFGVASMASRRSRSGPHPRVFSLSASGGGHLFPIGDLFQASISSFFESPFVPVVVSLAKHGCSWSQTAPNPKLLMLFGMTKNLRPTSRCSLSALGLGTWNLEFETSPRRATAHLIRA